MKKGLFVLFFSLALLFPLGSTFAEESERIVVDSRNGVDYAITLGEHSPNSGGLSIEEVAKLTGKSVDELEREFKLQEDLDTIVEYLENNLGEDKSAGIYLEGNKIVLNLKEINEQLNNELLTKLNHPEDIEIREKKYSIEELKEMRSKLPIGKLGITGVGLDEKGNKVNVYISKQNYEKYKEEIKEYLDESLITWVFKELNVQTRSRTVATENHENGTTENALSSITLRPGNAVKDATNFRCSIAFHAKSHGNDSAITAGHCSEAEGGYNLNWYDIVSGDLIGQLTIAINGSNDTADVGSIETRSNVNSSYQLADGSTTVGNFYSNNSLNRVGYSVNTLGNSGNYLSVITDTSVQVRVDGELSPKDLVLADFGDPQDVTQGGDSGGIVYSIQRSPYNGKYYAVIVGIHKGLAGYDQQVYSKFSNAYSELNLSSVVVDPSYWQ